MAGISLRPMALSAVLGLSLISLFQNCAPMAAGLGPTHSGLASTASLLTLTESDPIVSISHDPAGQRVTIELDHAKRTASAQVTDSLVGQDRCASVPVNYSAVVEALGETQLKSVELKDNQVIVFGGPTLDTKLASGAEATHFLGSGSATVLVDYEPLLTIMSGVNCP